MIMPIKIFSIFTLAQEQQLQCERLLMTITKRQGAQRPSPKEVSGILRTKFSISPNHYAITLILAVTFLLL